MPKHFKLFLIPIAILAMGIFLSVASLAQEETTSLPPAETPVQEQPASPSQGGPASPPANENPQPTEEQPASEPTEATPAVQEDIQNDTDIKPEDLGVVDQKILPNNPFYFLKKMSRGVQSAFTFNPVKKAELKLKFANEKIIEAKNLAEKTQDKKILEQSLDNYKQELDTVKDEVSRIKNSASEDKNVDKFVDKFVDNNIKQQKLIDKLEEKLPEQVFDKIQEIKEDTAQKFADIALKVSNPEEISNKIINITENQAGSDFKDFKNIEVLKRVEEKVPEQAKEAIKQAQEKSMERFTQKMEQKEDMRQKFKNYLGNVSGNEIKKLEIVQEFQAQMIPPQIRDVMDGAKNEAMNRIKQRMMGGFGPMGAEKFLKPLEGGRMEDFRIIKELENNLPSDVTNKLMEIKNKSMGNFQEELRNANTPEQQAVMMKKMQEFKDVKQLSMFKEMDAIIPEDKKEFWAKVKNETQGEMERNFAGANGEMEKRMIIEQMAGEDPEDMKIIQEFGPPPAMLNDILKEQAARLSERINTTEDAEKLQILKNKIEEEDSIKGELQKRNPEIFKNMEIKAEDMMSKMDAEKAQKQIEKAQNEITLADSEMNASPNLAEIKLMSPAEKILGQAKNKLAKAQTALTAENFGMAFGNATAALQMSNEVRKIIKEVSLRSELGEKKRGQGGPEGQGGPFSPGGFPSQTPFNSNSDTEQTISDSDMISTTPENCSCPGGAKQPVCGADGKIYKNECTASCNNIKIKEDKSCLKTSASSSNSSSGQQTPSREMMEKIFKERQDQGGMPQGGFGELKSNEGSPTPEQIQQFKEQMPFQKPEFQQPPQGDFGSPKPGEGGPTPEQIQQFQEQNSNLQQPPTQEQIQQFQQQIMQQSPQNFVPPQEMMPIFEMPSGAVSKFIANLFCSKKQIPVCGTNGKTYYNQCYAKLSGVKIQSLGVCVIK